MLGRQSTMYTLNEKLWFIRLLHWINRIQQSRNKDPQQREGINLHDSQGAIS